MIKRAIIALQLILSIAIAQASTTDDTIVIDSLHKYKIIELQDEIYHGNLMNRFRDRRVDREINKNKFIFAGEKIAGLTASHFSLSGENAEYLLLLTNIDANVTMTTIKPYVGYFYRDNRAVGAKFIYSHINGSVDTSTLDFGDTNDLSFDIPYVSLNNESYSLAIFHRAYAALDNAGRYGVFADVQLAATTGKSTFEYDNGDSISSTLSKSRTIGLSFNPGICAFIMHNVSASMSFEFGGVDFTRIDQYDAAGEFVGSRTSSKMKFMFNVLAVNLGFTIHIW